MNFVSKNPEMCSGIVNKINISSRIIGAIAKVSNYNMSLSQVTKSKLKLFESTTKCLFQLFALC